MEIKLSNKPEMDDKIEQAKIDELWPDIKIYMTESEITAANQGYENLAKDPSKYNHQHVDMMDQMVVRKVLIGKLHEEVEKFDKLIELARYVGIFAALSWTNSPLEKVEELLAKAKSGVEYTELVNAPKEEIEASVAAGQQLAAELFNKYYEEEAE